jgi:anti-sigma factor ChrR (cupin superfamily)
MNSPTDADLPDGLTQAMLGDVAGVDVAPELAARIKGRVLARIGAAQPAAPAEARPGFVDVLAAAGWQPFAPGVEMKILFEDGVSRSWMVRMAPGAQLPAHEHDVGEEECLVLEGDVWLGDQLFGPGDYQLAERGTWHGPVRSDRGCVMFVRSRLAPAQAA